MIVLEYVLREAIPGQEESLGLTIKPRQGRLVEAEKVAELNFADHIALFSDQELLTTRRRSNWTCWELQVSGFMDQWLRTWLQDQKGFSLLDSLEQNEKSVDQKTVEPVLLFGSETWTVTKKLEKSVNGCYNRMLRTALNVQWQQHMNNQELYGSLQRISETIRARRLTLAGHCSRHYEETASKVLLWEPQHGHPNRGTPRTTYMDTIKADTRPDNTKQIRGAMFDQVVWKDFIRIARDDSLPKQVSK